MTRTIHKECKAGAAVRLFGLVPATVVRVYRRKSRRREGHAPMLADCRVTIRTKRHGYAPGQIVTVHAYDAVPRDCVHAAAGGRVAWDHFIITTGAMRE